MTGINHHSCIHFVVNVVVVDVDFVTELVELMRLVIIHLIVVMQEFDLLMGGLYAKNLIYLNADHYFKSL